MRVRFSGSIATLAIAGTAVGIIILRSFTGASAQAPVATATAPTPTLPTPWGEPDLQGIWTDVYLTPLQRSARYAGKESFTDAERAALDEQRADIEFRPRQQTGTERDVAGAYNSVFMSVKPTGRRTSLIVDPPDGSIPPLTPEAQKTIAAEREYRLALLQATTTCKNQDPAGRGWRRRP